MNLIESVLQKAMNEGKLQKVPVSYLSCVDWGMLHGVLELMTAQYYQGKITDWNHFFRFIENILVNGLIKK